MSNFYVSVPDQLSASVESVVGLYVDKGQSLSQLLFSKKGESPTTYKIKNNQSNIVNKTPIKVNISLEARIGKTMYMHGYMYISNDPDLFFIAPPCIFTAALRFNHYTLNNDISMSTHSSVFKMAALIQYILCTVYVKVPKVFGKLENLCC